MKLEADLLCLSRAYQYKTSQNDSINNLKTNVLFFLLLSIFGTLLYMKLPKFEQFALTREAYYEALVK